MASEYLMKKYQDVKPDVPKELTEKEKRANWWHYHRIHFLVGALVLALVASFVWEMVSKVEPDFQIAYVGEKSLAMGVAEQIEAQLAELAFDKNGDGQVVVQVNSYVIDPEDTLSYTTQVSLMGDISVGSSDFFLVEDPVDFQENYGILTMVDGSVYDDDMDPEQCVRYAAEDCQGLNQVDLGTELYLCRRVFVKEDDLQAHASADILWEAMTGALEK